MIIKDYHVICDICGTLLGNYGQYKPTHTKLRADGIKIVFNNGKAHTICAECFNNLPKKLDKI